MADTGAAPTSTPLVRLWTTDWQLKGIILADQVAAVADGWSLTLPSDEPLAQWMWGRPESSKPRACYLTVDDGGVRWSGVLDTLVLDKAGLCTECPHCQQQRVSGLFNTMPPQTVRIGYLNTRPS